MAASACASTIEPALTPAREPHQPLIAGHDSLPRFPAQRTISYTGGSGLGSSLGSWTGGLLHDWTHSYNPVIAFSLVAVVLGMIPFLVVPALRR